MNISAASKAAGLPVKTVRYYADIGLVEAPSWVRLQHWRMSGASGTVPGSGPNKLWG